MPDTASYIKTVKQNDFTVKTICQRCGEERFITGGYQVRNEKTDEFIKGHQDCQNVWRARQKRLIRKYAGK